MTRSKPATSLRTFNAASSLQSFRRRPAREVISRLGTRFGRVFRHRRPNRKRRWRYWLARVRFPSIVHKLLYFCGFLLLQGRDSKAFGLEEASAVPDAFWGPPCRTITKPQPRFRSFTISIYENRFDNFKRVLHTINDTSSGYLFEPYMMNLLTDIIFSRVAGPWFVYDLFKSYSCGGWLVNWDIEIWFLNGGNEKEKKPCNHVVFLDKNRNLKLLYDIHDQNLQELMASRAIVTIVDSDLIYDMDYLLHKEFYLNLLYAYPAHLTEIRTFLCLLKGSPLVEVLSSIYSCGDKVDNPRICDMNNTEVRQSSRSKDCIVMNRWIVTCLYSYLQYDSISFLMLLVEFTWHYLLNFLRLYEMMIFDDCKCVLIALPRPSSDVTEQTWDIFLGCEKKIVWHSTSVNNDVELSFVSLSIWGHEKAKTTEMIQVTYESTTRTCILCCWKGVFLYARPQGALNKTWKLKMKWRKYCKSACINEVLCTESTPYNGKMKEKTVGANGGTCTSTAKAASGEPSSPVTEKTNHPEHQNAEKDEIDMKDYKQKPKRSFCHGLFISLSWLKYKSIVNQGDEKDEYRKWIWFTNQRTLVIGTRNPLSFFNEDKRMEY